MEKDTITGSYDIIIMKNGNEVLAKILEIGINEIKFKKFDYLNGPIIVVEKSDIFMIKYNNGTKELFNDKNDNKSNTSNDLCYNGQYDAKTRKTH